MPADTGVLFDPAHPSPGALTGELVLLAALIVGLAVLVMRAPAQDRRMRALGGAAVIGLVIVGLAGWTAWAGIDRLLGPVRTWEGCVTDYQRVRTHGSRTLVTGESRLRIGGVPMIFGNAHARMTYPDNQGAVSNGVRLRITARGDQVFRLEKLGRCAASSPG